ncbi:MAG: gliding motility-associated C-terminal domain-containing protein [Spirosomataceae bacterium]
MAKYRFIILLIISSIAVNAQNLCTNPPSGSATGGFTLSAASICVGQSITLTDNSGGTNVRYVYDYRGESASQLNGVTSTTNPYVVDGTFTILQYGKKGTQDMYACKVVTVRTDNTPKFSSTPCNDRLEIIIPNDPANNFDSYRVDWGDGNPAEVVTTLPFQRVKSSLTFPRTIKVEGVYNSIPACSAPVGIVIPLLVPSASGINLLSHPNISKLELKTASSAELTITGSYEGNGYNLFMTERGQPYPSSPKQTGIKPGTFTIAIPDTNKSYCFQISKPILCGIEISAEICTAVLQSVNPVNKTNVINWVSYPTQMTGIINEPIFGRFLTSNSRLVKKENSSTLPKIPVNGTTYTDSPIDCSKKYCYRLEVSTQGQLYYYNFTGVSLSKEICIDRKSFNPPPITDATVSVLNNKIDINYTDNSGWSLQKIRYRLLRENSGNFSAIDSVNTPATNLKDLQATPDQQSYCYKVGYFDECGSYSQLSPPFCSIFLKEDPTNSLTWTPNSPFAASNITNYELIPFDEVTNAPLSAITLSATPTNYTPNLSNFQDEAKFVIRTTSNTGKISNSNIVSIPIKPLILVPEAFTPNGDGINDEFKVVGTLRRVTDFEMSIYNRWGTEVFRTMDKDTPWDGKLGGADIPTGLYIYKIKSKFSTGIEVDKKGSILLMR